jgi:hypothetical protein
MNIACKCKSCNGIHMQHQDELTLEFDFMDELVRFICPNCKYMNEMSFRSLAEKNKRMPLPNISVSRG